MRAKRNLFIGITSRTVMVIFAVLLLLSYISQFINPSKAWIMTFFGLIFAPLLICNIVFLIWALARKSRSALIPLIVILPTLTLVDRYWKFPGSRTEDPDGLKIITYNVGRFALSQEDRFSSWKECADSVMAFLRKEDPDIVCFQEFYYGNANSIKEYFASRMPGYHVRYFVNIDGNGCAGNLTLSKYKVLDKGKIEFENSANMALFTDLLVEKDTIRLYNCHFQSYGISLPRLYQSLEADYKRTVKDTEERMKSSIERRPRQVDQVMEDIEKCPLETIVVGDFNDTPMSYTYVRLSRRHKDSFENAGRGIGATYSKLWPLLRIDFILFPERYEASYHKVLDKDYSDHYPVEAIIGPVGERK